MQLDKVIDKRKSVRKFSLRKPNWRKIIDAIDFANKIPLAGNIPTVRFILVDDEKKIKELAQAARQHFIAQAHYVVVVCSDYTQLVRSYDERGEKYGMHQAGAAIENFLLRIVDLGLASCWVGAFSDETVRRILKIPDNINIEALLPIGYETRKSKKKKKPRTDAVLYFNEYNNKFMKPKRMPEGV